MNENKMYYMLKNGRWVRRYAINQAFEVTTGLVYRPDSYQFIRFFKKLVDDGAVIKAKSADHFTISEIREIAKNQELIAVTIYHDKEDCPLVQARKEVKELLK